MPRAAIVSRVSLRIRTSGAGITEIVEATIRRTGAKSAGGYDPHTSRRRPPPNPDLLVWRPSLTSSTEGQQGAPEIVRGDPRRPASTMRVRHHSRDVASPPPSTFNPKVAGSNPARPILGRAITLTPWPASSLRRHPEARGDEP